MMYKFLLMKIYLNFWHLIYFHRQKWNKNFFSCVFWSYPTNQRSRIGLIHYCRHHSLHLAGYVYKNEHRAGRINFVYNLTSPMKKRRKIRNIFFKRHLKLILHYVESNIERKLVFTLKRKSSEWKFMWKVQRIHLLLLYQIFYQWSVLLKTETFPFPAYGGLKFEMKQSCINKICLFLQKDR